MAFNLTAGQTYAQQVIREKLNSGLFNRSPFLSFFISKSKDANKFGRPGSGAIFGGKNLSKAQKELIAGGREHHVRIITGLSAGGKYTTATDTTPTVTAAADQKRGTAVFKWTRHLQPIKVWNSTLLLAGGGKYEVASAIDEAVEQALEEQITTLATSIYSGNPADQTAVLWSDLSGLIYAVADDNTYGGVDRTVVGEKISGVHPWSGKKVTAATPATLSIVDNANFTQGAANAGPGVDLVVTTNANYVKLKAEAVAKGGTIVNNGEVPQIGMSGYKNELIMYGNTAIIADPFCPANALFALNTADYVLAFNSKANFVTHPFTDRGDTESGGDDAKTSMIETMVMFFCEKPWNSVYYSSVS